MTYVLEKRMWRHGREETAPFSHLTPQLFHGSAGVSIVGADTGFRILAECEASMQRAVERIHTYLPGHFKTGPLMIRYRATPELREPVMWVFILAPPHLVRPVRRALLLRSGKLVGLGLRDVRRVFYAKAPLSGLLGLKEELTQTADQEVEVSMTFSHYAPVAWRTPSTTLGTGAHRQADCAKVSVLS